ncbi:MAG: hypothetical protein EP343_17840 [Deltaproteobacteria bacterium]|nr:MAG: hypothetical protein EP343_17840 [Deltaproteobacteria bacterium]
MHLLERKESQVWVFLLLLTVLGFHCSTPTLPHKSFINIPLWIIYGLKFLVVAYYFMELETAHVIWKVGILSFLLTTIGGILLLT